MIFILIEFNISNWISEIVTKLFMIGFVIWCSSTHPFISTQFPPPTSPVSLLPPLCCLCDRHFSPLCLSIPPFFWELWFAIQIVKGYQISSFTYYQHSVPEQSDHFQLLLSYCFLLCPNCHTHFQTLTNPLACFSWHWMFVSYYFLCPTDECSHSICPSPSDSFHSAW